MMWGEKDQLDATEEFIELIIRSTCFGHLSAHHQELETIQMLCDRDEGYCFATSLNLDT